MPFRLSPGQMRDLEAVANSLGKTRQRFLADLVLHEIAQHKETQKIKKQPISTSPVSSPVEGGGLGISAPLQKAKEIKDPVVEQPASVAPVVVNVGNTDAPVNGNTKRLTDLDRLAIYVVKGDEFMRDMRKRAMLEVLRASATTDEEYNVLVAQLEQNIALKTKTAEENTPANKLARLAFDKLTSLLRGD